MVEACLVAKFTHLDKGMAKGAKLYLRLADAQSQMVKDLAKTRAFLGKARVRSPRQKKCLARLGVRPRR